MAYMFVLDERSDGLRFFQAGQLDLRDSHFEFLGVYGRLAPNQYAYGELTAANGQFGRDVDIFDFGILAPGRYRVTVDNYTWDFLNFDFLSISQITLQDEFFRTIDTRFFAPSSIDFVVQEASRYFLELTGPFGGNAQYRLTYSKTGELIAPNNPAVFAETASIFGELVPGSIISAKAYPLESGHPRCSSRGLRRTLCSCNVPPCPHAGHQIAPCRARSSRRGFRTTRPAPNTSFSNAGPTASSVRFAAAERPGRWTASDRHGNAPRVGGRLR